MTFYSILYNRPVSNEEKETPEAPVFFVDLNLDQVISAITAGLQEYVLKPFFYTPLKDKATILYRQAIGRDLENEPLFSYIKSFGQKMVIVRRYDHLSKKIDFQYYKEGWFLEAVEVYCEAIVTLANELNQLPLTSDGLVAFREYLSEYANSSSFLSFTQEARQIKADLAKVKYCVLIKENTVKVRKYLGETDYSLEVMSTFEKFKQGAVKDNRVQLFDSSPMNHVEAQILEYVARLYPDIFRQLDTFYADHENFIEETIRIFDREVQFYLAYLEFISTFKLAGLSFCYPEINDQDKAIFDLDGFDIALALKLINANAPIVCNDFHLQGAERIFIVSGPNQGGKTTFARTFGQLHYLASLGCPVPGKQAKLFLFDKLFTHFEKEEDIKNLRGKLLDDLVRIHNILRQSTPNSIIIMNEIFTSTALQDAIFLSKKIIERMIGLDVLGVCVTFIDELADLSEKTVSVVSNVAPDNPTLRTFKITRRPADGLAYAISIAEKYHLTYIDLKERIQS